MGSVTIEQAPQMIVRLIDVDKGWYSAMVDSLVAIAPAAQEHSPMIAALLADQDWRVRQAALRILEGMGAAAKEHTSKIALLLRDVEWRNRALAIQVLRAIGALDKELAPEIAALLDDKDVRFAAVEALGELGPAAKEYAPHVAALLKDVAEDDAYTIEALKAMGPLDITTIPYILSPIYDTRSRAAELRFLAHFLGGGEQDAKTFIRWLGRPDRLPLTVLRDDGVRALEIFARAWEPSSSLRWLRYDLEQQIARVASHVRWQVEDLPLLRRHAANLEAVRSTHVASIRNVIASLESWLWIHEHRVIFIAVVAYIVVLPLVWFTFLGLRPLWLYRINEALKPETDLR